MFQPAEKLAVVTQYLRSTHCYCVWCGTAFDGWLISVLFRLIIVNHMLLVFLSAFLLTNKIFVPE